MVCQGPLLRLVRHVMELNMAWNTSVVATVQGLTPIFQGRDLLCIILDRQPNTRALRLVFTAQPFCSIKGERGWMAKGSFADYSIWWFSHDFENIKEIEIH